MGRCAIIPTFEWNIVILKWDFVAMEFDNMDICGDVS